MAAARRAASSSRSSSVTHANGRSSTAAHSDNNVVLPYPAGAVTSVSHASRPAHRRRDELRPADAVRSEGRYREPPRQAGPARAACRRRRAGALRRDRPRPARAADRLRAAAPPPPLPKPARTWARRGDGRAPTDHARSFLAGRVSGQGGRPACSREVRTTGRRRRRDHHPVGGMTGRLTRLGSHHGGSCRGTSASSGAQRRAFGRRWSSRANRRRAMTMCSGAKVELFVQLGALLALGAATSSLRRTVERARAAGATESELVGVLVAVGPAVGLARLVAIAPRLASAIGYDLGDGDEGTGGPGSRCGVGLRALWCPHRCRRHSDGSKYRERITVDRHERATKRRSTWLPTSTSDPKDSRRRVTPRDRPTCWSCSASPATSPR